MAALLRASQLHYASVNKEGISQQAKYGCDFATTLALIVRRQTR